MKTLIAATIAATLATPAFAWISDPPAPNVTANPSARAGAVASSSSTSAASARVSGRVSNRVTVNNTTSGTSGVDPATLAALEAGRGGQQLPAASAYAPSFYGANPCTGPATSLGAQFQLFGLSVGGQTMDRVCQLLELHQQAAALEYLCDADSEVRKALARTGSPCMADRQPPVTPVNDGPTPPAPVHPAWCKRAHPTTDASRLYVIEQCGQ